jgi:hypothetical protein
LPVSAAVAPLSDGPQPNAMPAAPLARDDKDAPTRNNTSTEEAKSRWEAYKRSFTAADESRAKTFDLETVGKQIMEAVKDGRISEDQAKAKWAAIEKMANSKGKGDKEDAPGDSR